MHSIRSLTQCASLVSESLGFRSVCLTMISRWLSAFRGLLWVGLGHPTINAPRHGFVCVPRSVLVSVR